MFFIFISHINKLLKINLYIKNYKKLNAGDEKMAQTKKCCQSAENETNRFKRILKKIWAFFFGCNCH